MDKVLELINSGTTELPPDNADLKASIISILKCLQININLEPNANDKIAMTSQQIEEENDKLEMTSQLSDNNKLSMPYRYIFTGLHFRHK